MFDLDKYMYSSESIGRSNGTKFTAEEQAVIIAMSKKFGELSPVITEAVAISKIFSRPFSSMSLKNASKII